VAERVGWASFACPATTAGINGTIETGKTRYKL
jgi:hypothetical protein